jgi:hypothetical protein
MKTYCVEIAAFEVINEVLDTLECSEIPQKSVFPG